MVENGFLALLWLMSTREGTGTVWRSTQKEKYLQSLCIPQDTDTTYSIYNHSWMAHVSGFGVVSNGSEQRQLLAPEACLAGESLPWKKKRSGFPHVSSLQLKERKSIANCCWHDMDSVRHGKIPAKRKYLQGSAEALEERPQGCMSQSSERYVIQNWRAGETSDSLPDF